MIVVEEFLTIGEVFVNVLKCPGSYVALRAAWLKKTTKRERRWTLKTYWLCEGFSKIL